MNLEWFETTRRRQTAPANRVDLTQGLSRAIEGAAVALERKQQADGYWCGELTADTTLESDFVFLELWLHPPDGRSWNPPSAARIQKACRSILARQLTDGGWCIYPGGPSEVNATVRAYSALKLGGIEPSSPAMAKARERALALGGLQACNSYTKINLSLFGLYPKKYAPSIPPEIVLLPLDILYQMSSWTRAILVPLSIVQSVGKQRPVPAGFDLDELFHPKRKLSLPKRSGLSFAFHHLDRAVKMWERRGLKDVRSAAIREAEHWMLDRTRYTEGLGAIYPSMMYLIMALESLGYPEDHPDLIEAKAQFDRLIMESEDRFQFQPCVSPVWDTAYALFALGEACSADPAPKTRAADWLISKEVRRKGDWSVKRPNLEPSGWAFEFANEFYPDIDDTAMVLLGLRHATATDPARQERTTRRALNWLIGMQGSDGGWAAFDVDNDWKILNQVPFADHNAMLDPSCPDITGRVLECLASYGYRAGKSSPGDRAVDAGIRYLLMTQENDGSWYGRWGVNYIYGTFLAMRGLRATADVRASSAMTRGAAFLRGVQNHDGGWGESCASYNVNRYVPAESTASQTAWALLGLAASGDTGSHAVNTGIQYLLRTQLPDGTWHENLATGTGFPNVFYLTYHLYRHYFPLLALSTFSPKLQATKA
jgi:squalene-hopene/tetraprenyl-beta-curcumene cyclase